MGNKFYKRPTLKEKEQRRKVKSSTSSSLSNRYDEDDDERFEAGPSRTKPATSTATTSARQRNDMTDQQRLAKLKKEAQDVKRKIADTKRQEQEKRPPKGSLFSQDDDLEEDESAAANQEEEEEVKPKRTRTGRAKKRFKVPQGEARTPKEAGIDYIAQFEGKKNYTV